MNSLQLSQRIVIISCLIGGMMVQDKQPYASQSTKMAVASSLSSTTAVTTTPSSSTPSSTTTSPKAYSMSLSSKSTTNDHTTKTTTSTTPASTSTSPIASSTSLNSKSTSNEYTDNNASLSHTTVDIPFSTESRSSITESPSSDQTSVTTEGATDHHSYALEAQGQKNHMGGMEMVYIIIGVVGAAVTAVVIVCYVLVIKRRRRRKIDDDTEKADIHDNCDNMTNGDVGLEVHESIIDTLSRPLPERPMEELTFVPARSNHIFQSNQRDSVESNLSAPYASFSELDIDRFDSDRSVYCLAAASIDDYNIVRDIDTASNNPKLVICDGKSITDLSILGGDGPEMPTDIDRTNDSPAERDSSEAGHGMSTENDCFKDGHVVPVDSDSTKDGSVVPADSDSYNDGPVVPAYRDSSNGGSAVYADNDSTIDGSVVPSDNDSTNENSQYNHECENCDTSALVPEDSDSFSVTVQENPVYGTMSENHEPVALAANADLVPLNT